MEYKELDRTTRLNLIGARLRDLENQHFNLDLRVGAPDLNQPPSEMDQANLTRLEDSIAKLRQMEQELQADNKPSQ